MYDSSLKTEDEENCTLMIKAKKGEGKASHSILDSYH